MMISLGDMLVSRLRDMLVSRLIFSLYSLRGQYTLCKGAFIHKCECLSSGLTHTCIYGVLHKHCVTNFNIVSGGDFNVIHRTGMIKNEIIFIQTIQTF